MWPRLRIDDVRAIVHYLGILVIVIGVLMIVPLAFAVALREWNPAIWFMLSTGITLSIGGAMNLVKPIETGLSHKQAMIVTGLAWIVGSAVTAIPLFLSGNYASYFDALFNAISYLSGTGMSLMQTNDAIPVSMIIWRSIMVTIGALGIVLVAMGLGTISQFSGAGVLFKAEGHRDRIMPQVKGTSRFITIFLGFYIFAGTLACTLVLMASSGLEPGNALLHGFALATNAVATSGTTLPATGIAYYHNPLLNVILAILMLVGTFSFALYFYMAKKGPREFFRDIETRTIIAWGGIVAILLAISLASDSYFNQIGMFIDKGIFNMVSAITGTGFSTFGSAQIANVASSAVVFSLVVGMLMGGATSSTAGGFKAIRLALMVKTIILEVRRSLMPTQAREAIRYRHFGDQTLTASLSRSVMLVIMLYVISFGIGAILGVACGYDPISAVMESVSCTVNCGLTAGIIIPGMPGILKACYFIQMLAGRLEFLTLLTTIASIGTSLWHAATTSKATRAVVSAIPYSIRRAWRGDSASAASASRMRSERSTRYTYAQNRRSLSSQMPFGETEKRAERSKRHGTRR